MLAHALLVCKRRKQSADGYALCGSGRFLGSDHPLSPGSVAKSNNNVSSLGNTYSQSFGVFSFGLDVWHGVERSLSLVRRNRFYGCIYHIFHTSLGRTPLLEKPAMASDDPIFGNHLYGRNSLRSSGIQVGVDRLKGTRVVKTKKVGLRCFYDPNKERSHRNSSPDFRLSSDLLQEEAFFLDLATS